jgi:hypothetical protein
MEVQSLSRRVAALDQEMRAVRALRQAHSRQQRRVAQSQALRGTRLEVRTCLSLALAAPDVLPVVSYAERRRVAPYDIEDFLGRVVRRYLAMNEGGSNEMLWPTTSAGRERLMVARRFLLEYDVHGWLGAETESKGLAPSIADVLRRRNELAAFAQQGDRPEELYGVSHTAAYRWARRFAGRWRLRTLQPSQHEMEPRETSRAKVCCSDVDWSFGHQLRAPTRLNVRFNEPGQGSAKQRGRCSGPDSVPSC